MKILINGKHKEFDAALNLSGVIGQVCQNTDHVIAEVNGEIIKKEAWESSTIQDGDQIELVSFVGGG